MATITGESRTCAADTPAVLTESLVKTFGRTRALAEVDLRVEQGEVFGLLGPNGAGKSTLVKILMGLVYPSAGRVRMFGRPVTDHFVKQRVGFLPENFRFPEWLTAEELLDLHGRLAGMEMHERKKRAGEVLSLVGLSERAKDPLRTYSKGMQQRVGMAQALIANPAIVFLDEPTSALDPLGRREVRDLLRGLKADGITVFLNSHLLSEVESVCDRVAIIDRGQTVRCGRLDELLVRGELEVRVAAATEALLKALESRFKVLSASSDRLVLAIEEEDDVHEVAKIVLDSGAILRALTPRKNSLEELFTETIEKERRQ